MFVLFLPNLDPLFLCVYTVYDSKWSVIPANITTNLKSNSARYVQMYEPIMEGVTCCVNWNRTETVRIMLCCLSFCVNNFILILLCCYCLVLIHSMGLFCLLL